MGLLNVDGFYNSLLCFIDKAVDEGFIAPSARHIIISAPTAHELMAKLEVYTYSFLIRVMSCLNFVFVGGWPETIKRFGLRLRRFDKNSYESFY